jgi:hypothetical protein
MSSRVNTRTRPPGRRRRALPASVPAVTPAVEPWPPVGPSPHSRCSLFLLAAPERLGTGTSQNFEVVPRTMRSWLHAREVAQALGCCSQHAEMRTCAINHNAIGRRPAPSVRCAPRWWTRKRGVNDPGTGWRLSPHPYPSGSFTPRVSLVGEARVWCSIVRRICGPERTDRIPILHQMRSRSRRPSRPESYALDTTPYKVLRCAPTARIARGSRVALSSP